jgi:hypothetical protein
MKQILKATVIIAISIFTAFSCSKDNDDQITNTGTMSYMNKSYEIKEARITEQEYSNGITRYGITLYGTDVKWTTAGTFTDGHTVSFDLYCNGQNGVAAGTYMEDDSDDYIHLKAGYSLFLEVKSTYPYTDYSTLHPKKIVVKVSDNVYEISFNGSDMVDRSFTASYKGSLRKK